MFGRIFCGAFVGCVLGAFVEPICFWDGPPSDGGIRLPVVGPSVGAILVACIGGSLGDYELSEQVKLLSIAVLIGVVVGALGGAFVFPPLMAYLAFDREYFFWGKEEAIYQQIGVLFGAPIGAIAGLASGPV